VPVPVEIPAAPAAPAAAGAEPSAPAAPTEPKNTDFPDTEEGSEQFLSALHKWETDHPAGEQPKPGEAEAPKQPEAEADAGKPAAEPVAAPTPERLAKLIEDAPELAAALEAHPKAKEQVFEMARQLAAADPIVKMFPTVGDAEFAQQNTRELLGLKTASMRLARSPESAPQFLEAFDSAYLTVNEKGEPVLDAQGQPVYGADYRPAIEALVGREIGGYTQQFTSEMDQLKGKLATGVYPSEAAKEHDQTRLDNLQMASDALEILEMVRSGEYFKEPVPELPADATPEMRAYFERQKAELAEQQKKLDESTAGASKQARTQQAQQFDAQVRQDAGTQAGSVITQIFKQKTEAGLYIPEFYLQEKYVDADRNSPTFGQETQLPAIYMRIWNAYQREINLGPDGKPYPETDSRAVMQRMQHELRPPNEQTRGTMKEWHQKQIAQRIPRLVDAEIKRIETQVKMDLTKQGERSAARAQAVQPEPRSAGSSLPQGATDAEVLRQVQAQIDANPASKGWDSMEMEAQRASAFHRMRAGGKK
jgi:hypothetical protein